MIASYITIYQEKKKSLTDHYVVQVISGVVVVSEVEVGHVVIVVVVIIVVVPLIAIDVADDVGRHSDGGHEESEEGDAAQVATPSTTIGGRGFIFVWYQKFRPRRLSTRIVLFCT